MTNVFIHTKTLNIHIILQRCQGKFYIKSEWNRRTDWNFTCSQFITYTVDIHEYEWFCKPGEAPTGKLYPYPHFHFKLITLSFRINSNYFNLHFLSFHLKSYYLDSYALKRAQVCSDWMTITRFTWVKSWPAQTILRLFCETSITRVPLILIATYFGLE